MTMNPALSSFTLCPSSSAFEEYKKQQQTALDEVSFTTKRNAGFVHTTIQSIRVSPFEPLLHKRDFPKSGRISPVTREEYMAYVRQPIPSRSRGSRGDSFPYTSLGAIQEKLGTPLETKERDVTYKEYLQTQLEASKARLRMLDMLEDQRQMKIQINSLKALLHQASKTTVDANSQTMTTTMDVSTQTPSNKVSESSTQTTETIDEASRVRATATQTVTPTMNSSTQTTMDDFNDGKEPSSPEKNISDQTSLSPTNDDMNVNMSYVNDTRGTTRMFDDESLDDVDLDIPITSGNAGSIQQQSFPATAMGGTTAGTPKKEKSTNGDTSPELQVPSKPLQKEESPEMESSCFGKEASTVVPEDDMRMPLAEIPPNLKDALNGLSSIEGSVDAPLEEKTNKATTASAVKQDQVPPVIAVEVPKSSGAPERRGKRSRRRPCYFQVPAIKKTKN